MQFSQPENFHHVLLNDNQTNQATSEVVSSHQPDFVNLTDGSEKRSVKKTNASKKQKSNFNRIVINEYKSNKQRYRNLKKKKNIRNQGDQDLVSQIEGLSLNKSAPGNRKPKQKKDIAMMEIEPSRQ